MFPVIALNSICKQTTKCMPIVLTPNKTQDSLPIACQFEGSVQKQNMKNPY